MAEKNDLISNVLYTPPVDSYDVPAESDCELTLHGADAAYLHSSLEKAAELHPDQYCTAVISEAYPLQSGSYTPSSWEKNRLSVLTAALRSQRDRAQAVKDYELPVESLYWRAETYSVISFDGKHNIEITLHVPRTPPPDGGYIIVPFDYGSAFRDENMKNTPHIARLADEAAQSGICIATIRYCVLSETRESVQANPEQAFAPEYAELAALRPESVTMAPSSPLGHMFNDAFVAWYLLSHPEKLQDQHPSFDPSRFNNDIRVGAATSSGGILALTASAWGGDFEVILYAGATSARFADFLSRPVIGPEDMKAVNHEGILESAGHADEDVSWPDSTHYRNLQDGVVPPGPHNSAVVEAHQRRGQNPDNHVTTVTFSDESDHGFTNVMKGDPENPQADKILATLDFFTVLQIKRAYADEDNEADAEKTGEGVALK